MPSSGTTGPTAGAERRLSGAGPTRLPETGTSIFAVMTQLADRLGAVNLAQGFPDFPVDPDLIDRVVFYLRQGCNQYAPMPGLPALRRVIATDVARRFDRQVDPDTEVTVTAGATEALFDVCAALVHPGDEVILFDPAYDSYVPAIVLAGGRPVRLPLSPPDFRPDWVAVRQAVTPRTRLIVINTPHNPTGAILTRSDLDELADLAGQTGLLVLSDEVYAPMVFDGAAHHGVLGHPGLAGRSVAVFSFGKAVHATGWKVGYAVANPALTTELRKVHQFVTFSVNTPVQHALADYLAEPGRLDGLAPFFQERRDRFVELLRPSRLTPLPCRGTYFLLVSYADVADKSDTAMAEHLTRTVGVASIPVSVFRSDGRDDRLLRFCFAKRPETLIEAAARLARV